jgi:hypothetical protein
MTAALAGTNLKVTSSCLSAAQFPTPTPPTVLPCSASASNANWRVVLTSMPNSAAPQVGNDSHGSAVFLSVISTRARYALKSCPQGGSPCTTITGPDPSP